MFFAPTLTTDNEQINLAYRIAVGDVASSVASFKDGLLEEPSPVLFAGIGYDSPWTRDAAINVWNCCGLLMPQIAKNTLLSTVKVDKGIKRIGGEYWDAIIWAIGAWWYFKYTNDKQFLQLAFEIIENSLQYFEDTEFDSDLNLFRGAACYGDGIASYPDAYATGSCGFWEFIKQKPHLCAKKGVGLPMHTLSTNCLYYEAYKIAYRLTCEEHYRQKAEALKDAINKHFWDEERGLYRYIVDNFGNCDHTEGMGHSFAILFGVASEEQSKRIVENQHVSPNGIQCVHPGFPRYQKYGIARHAETVWPQIQAFWADAVAKRDVSKFEHEFAALTKNAVRDGYFAEIYHPETGERYGGYQEWQNDVVLWKAEMRQLWSASGYIRMVLFNLVGMRFEEDGIYIKPLKNSLVKKIDLCGLKYRNAVIDIHITGKKHDKEHYISGEATGKIEITL